MSTTQHGVIITKSNPEGGVSIIEKISYKIKNPVGVKSKL